MLSRDLAGSPCTPLSPVATAHGQPGGCLPSHGNRTTGPPRRGGRAFPQKERTFSRALRARAAPSEDHFLRVRAGVGGPRLEPMVIDQRVSQRGVHICVDPLAVHSLFDRRDTPRTTPTTGPATSPSSIRRAIPGSWAPVRGRPRPAAPIHVRDTRSSVVGFSVRPGGKHHRGPALPGRCRSPRSCCRGPRERCSVCAGRVRPRRPARTR